MPEQQQQQWPQQPQDEAAGCLDAAAGGPTARSELQRVVCCVQHSIGCPTSCADFSGAYSDSKGGIAEISQSGCRGWINSTVHPQGRLALVMRGHDITLLLEGDRLARGNLRGDRRPVLRWDDGMAYQRFECTGAGSSREKRLDKTQWRYCAAKGLITASEASPTSLRPGASSKEDQSAPEASQQPEVHQRTSEAVWLLGGAGLIAVLLYAVRRCLFKALMPVATYRDYVLERPEDNYGQYVPPASVGRSSYELVPIMGR